MESIYLKVPKKEELNYRKLWLTDPKTMKYNANLNLDIKGYDKKNGTINLTDEELNIWYHKWINKEPTRYYAYIYVNSITEPIGEVYYYPEDDTTRVGIMISDKYRGNGYAYPALMELLKIAFEKNNLSELTDVFPSDRLSAVKVFEKVGFTYIAKEMIITKDIYFSNKNI